MVDESTVDTAIITLSSNKAVMGLITLLFICAIRGFYKPEANLKSWIIHCVNIAVYASASHVPPEICRALITCGRCNYTAHCYYLCGTL